MFSLQVEGAALHLKGGNSAALPIPRPIKLALAVGGIFFSFSYFALLQEDLFKKLYAGERFKSTFFMMVAERGVNALVAFIFLLVSGPPKSAEFPLRARHLRSKTRRIGRISRSPPPQILGGSGLKLPIDAISISGATQMLAMASSNEALKYVSYPTQVRIDARAPPRFSAVIMSPGGGVPLLGPLLPERIGS